MTKSKYAFRENIERLFTIGPVYLWTFTFPDVCGVQEASYRWNELLTWFRWAFKGAVFGIRVYELHKRHGVHIHALIAGRMDVNIVRVMAQRYGFGRINVVWARTVDAGHYLGKYLSKGRRREEFRGRRIWSVFGRMVGKTRVRDIEVNGALSDCFRQAGKLFRGNFTQVRIWAYKLFSEVVAGTRPCEFVQMIQ